MEALRLLSLNCHGFTCDTARYLGSIVANYDFILLQETWLSSANCCRLYDISNDFVYFHNSAMEEKLSTGILVGRPYGGTNNNNNKNTFVECHSAVASEALAEQVS